MWTGTRVYIPIPTLAPPFARGFCFSAAETRGQKNTLQPSAESAGLADSVETKPRLGSITGAGFW